MNTDQNANLSPKHDTYYHDAVVAHLEGADRDYRVDSFKSRSIFSYFMPTSHGNIRMEIFIKPWLDTFALYAYADQPVPEASRADLLEILANTNTGYNPLKSEIDPEKGWVRCGYAMFLFRDLVDPAHLDQMENTSARVMEYLLPTLEQYRQLSEHQETR